VIEGTSSAELWLQSGREPEANKTWYIYASVLQTIAALNYMMKTADAEVNKYECTLYIVCTRTYCIGK